VPPARSQKEDNEAVIDMAELRLMSPADRRELAGLLAELDKPAPAAPAPGTAPGPGHAALAPRDAGTPGEPDPARADPFRYDPSLRRERRLALLISAACCLILAGWIVPLP
jgi:hypothetical protein